jgi:CRP-like cAMP-binding protein
LIKDVKRTLSIRVKSDKCKVLALNRQAFNRILGDINVHLKKDYGDEMSSGS